MKLSIVTTLYRTEQHIHEFHARLSKVARDLVGDDYELIMVNDGSPDNSLAKAVALAQSDPHLVVVDLSRNFGHHKALMTGLDHAAGEFVALIDSDLEEQPEDLFHLAQEMRNKRCDVAFGVQMSRKGSAFERASGAAFYWLYEKMTGATLPRNLMTMRLMTRRYVDALLQHRERDMVIASLWQMTGFDQAPVPVTKVSQSRTSYSLFRKLGLLVTAVTAASNRPLLWVFYVGIALFSASLLYVGWLFMVWMLWAQPPGGWTSLIVSVWLLGGLTLCSIGVVGIYLAKVFLEVKQRPYAIIRAIYRARAEHPEPDFDSLAPAAKPAQPLAAVAMTGAAHE